MRQQTADSGLLGGQGDIDGTAFYQIHISSTINQRQHFASPQTLGQHGWKDIRLVIIGQGTEQIHIVDFFFAEQFFIGHIAKQNDTFW